MGNSGPPKCRTCGKAEWRHTCGGLEVASDRLARRGVAKVDALGAVSAFVVGPAGSVDIAPDFELVNASALGSVPVSAVHAWSVEEPEARKVVGPKAGRKEYMRRLMADKRAAEKAGLTLAEYRANQKARVGEK